MSITNMSVIELQTELENIAQSYMDKYGEMDENYDEYIYPFYDKVHQIPTYSLWEMSLPHISKGRLIEILVWLSDVDGGLNGIRTCDLMALIRYGVNNDKLFEKIFSDYARKLNRRGCYSRYQDFIFLLPEDESPYAENYYNLQNCIWHNEEREQRWGHANDADSEYNKMMELDAQYNFNDYENAPNFVHVLYENIYKKVKGEEVLVEMKMIDRDDLVNEFYNT